MKNYSIKLPNHFLSSEWIFYNHITVYPSQICVGCELYPRCRGGCPIMWTTHNAEEIISKAKNQKGDNANGKVPCSVPGFRNQVACTAN